MHKIFAKYWQNYIFITTFCQFSSLTLSIIKNNILKYQYVQGKFCIIIFIFSLTERKLLIEFGKWHNSASSTL